MEFDVTIEIPRGTATVRGGHASGRSRLDRMLFTLDELSVRLRLYRGHARRGRRPARRLRAARRADLPGCVIRARPIGVFQMTDEAGGDDKILCIPAGDPARRISPSSTRSASSRPRRSATSSTPTRTSNRASRSTRHAGSVGWSQAGRHRGHQSGKGRRDDDRALALPRQPPEGRRRHLVWRAGISGPPHAEQTLEAGGPTGSRRCGAAPVSRSNRHMNLWPLSAFSANISGQPPSMTVTRAAHPYAVAAADAAARSGRTVHPHHRDAQVATSRIVALGMLWAGPDDDRIDAPGDRAEVGTPGSLDLRDRRVHREGEIAVLEPPVDGIAAVAAGCMRDPVTAILLWPRKVRAASAVRVMSVLLADRPSTVRRRGVQRSWTGAGRSSSSGCRCVGGRARSGLRRGCADELGGDEPQDAAGRDAGEAVGRERPMVTAGLADGWTT